MKKIIAILLAVLFLMPVSAFADDEIRVYINDRAALSFDVNPQIVNSRLLVPMRGIFEALGAEIAWDAETYTVTAVSETAETITLTIGSNVMYKGSKAISLDTPAQIIDGRTMVPVRAVSEALGANVAWHDGTDDRSAPGFRYVHITNYPLYLNADIPIFDAVSGDGNYDVSIGDGYVVYWYPLADYGTKDFENDISDIDMYDLLLEEYGYEIFEVSNSDDMMFSYKKGDKIVRIGALFSNPDTLCRFVLIGDSKTITTMTEPPQSNWQLFYAEAKELMEYYHALVQDYNDEALAIYGQTFRYDPDEDEELQEAMAFAERQAKRDAVNRGQGSSYGADYAASQAAKQLIPYYKEMAKERFEAEKRSDYEFVMQLAEMAKSEYNRKLTELALDYNIKDYEQYLMD